MTTHTPEDLKSIRDELKWVTLREGETESLWGRSKAKILGNPLVPVGCLVTAGILCRGMYHFRKGHTEMQQKYMRYRVAAQGATIFALMFGILFLQPK